MRLRSVQFAALVIAVSALAPLALGQQEVFTPAAPAPFEPRRLPADALNDAVQLPPIGGEEFHVANDSPPSDAISSGAFAASSAVVKRAQQHAIERLPIRLGNPRRASGGVSLASAESQGDPVDSNPVDRKLSQALALPEPSKRGALKTPDGVPSTATIAQSLGIVLGVFLVVAWIARRILPRGTPMLPGEAVEVLGRMPLLAKQHVHLLRCGRKLLLVWLTPTGAETLTEITDPVEVERLVQMCKPGSSRRRPAFKQVLEEIQCEEPSHTFLAELQRQGHGDARRASSEPRRGFMETAHG